MSSLRNLLAVMLIAAGFNGMSASAQESEYLQQLNRQLVDACPNQWGSMPKYLLDSANHDEARLVYTQEMKDCLLYTSPSPRDKRQSRMPSSA